VSHTCRIDAQRRAGSRSIIACSSATMAGRTVGGSGQRAGVDCRYAAASAKPFKSENGIFPASSSYITTPSA